MNLQRAVLAAALVFVVSVSLGGTERDVPLKVADETAEHEWECSLSISTYLVQNGRDYANPNLVADRDWLHLEARYNYEAIKTGSLWLGYNFSFGKKLAFEGAPMLGGIAVAMMSRQRVWPEPSEASIRRGEPVGRGGPGR